MALFILGKAKRTARQTSAFPALQLSATMNQASPGLSFEIRTVVRDTELDIGRK
jgi:hypothetical protein